MTGFAAHLTELNQGRYRIKQIFHYKNNSICSYVPYKRFHLSHTKKLFFSSY